MSLASEEFKDFWMAPFELERLLKAYGELENPWEFVTPRYKGPSFEPFTPILY